MRWRVVLAPVCRVRGHVEVTAVAQRWNEGDLDRACHGLQVNVTGCIRCDRVLREVHLRARAKIRG